MRDESVIELSKLRLEKATECLEDAEMLLNAESYKSSANRCYYAVFHAMRAVLVLDGYDSKKHSGIISEFRKKYIKTDIFDKSLSVIIGNQFIIRSKSDYDDFYVISKKETVSQYEDAKTAVAMISDYLYSVY